MGVETGRALDKPYVICHMLTSINGKTTGSFLQAPQTLAAINAYETTNQAFNSRAYLTGRVSMEEHFTQGRAPELHEDAVLYPREDFIADPAAGAYIVVVDTAGKLGWESNVIHYMDRPPCHVVVLLTDKAPAAYRDFLRKRGISYLFAGDERLDAELALHKLKRLLGIDKIVLSGGGKTNEYFLQAQLIDEISLVVAPIVSHDAEEIDLFQKIDTRRPESALPLTLMGTEQLDAGTVWLRYQFKPSR